ncbi:MAG: hypothetical protein M0T74_17820 [Desulfitobacterium hafniense]|nr:hypothetical protein [Desulfitobacterium hafniense]
MRKQQKKRQRIFAIVVVAAVAITMIGSSFAMLGSSFLSSSTSSAGGSIQAQKALVERLSQSVEKNPSDGALQLELGNAYYDLAMSTIQTDMAASQPNFKKALEAYQVAVKTKRDINLLVDMATSAFYAGENDLADKTFKEAITEKPTFLNARFNYGIFLMNAKQDYSGAIEQWKTALGYNPSGADADRLKSLISTAQTKLDAQYQEMLNGPNPAKSGQGGK